MRKNNGFTLIELMITIAIVAILLGVAVPGFVDFIKNNRRTAAINQFVTDVHMARSEAAKQNQPVVICRRKNIVTPTCDDTAAWTNGWLVFVDTSGTEKVFDDTDELLAVRAAMSSELSVKSSSTTYGFKRFSSSASDTVRFCSDNHRESGRKVVLDRGRPRTEGIPFGETC